MATHPAYALTAERSVLRIWVSSPRQGLLLTTGIDETEDIPLLTTVHLTTFRRNMIFLYAFQASSRLWFDGALWVVYWQHRGMSLYEVGILEAVLHLVSLSLDIPTGIFADRIGWKLSLMLSSIAGVAYCLFSLLPQALPAGLLAFAFRGLQITLSSGSDMAFTYETVKLGGFEHRYQAISGRMFATQLVALGIAEWMGGWMAGHSWTAVYLSFAAANVVSLLCASFLKMPVRTCNLQSTHGPSFVTIVRDAALFARQSHSYRRWIAYSAILSGLIATYSFYGQSFLHSSGWSTVAIGLLTGVECGFSAVASAASEAITRKLKAPGIGVIAVAGMGLFAWLPGIAKGVGYLLAQSAGSAAEPLVDQRLNNLVPSTGRATLLSANSTAFSLFMVFVFPLFGALAGSIGTQNAYRWSSVLLAFCIILMFAWMLTAKKRNKLKILASAYRD